MLKPSIALVLLGLLLGCQPGAPAASVAKPTHHDEPAVDNGNDWARVPIGDVFVVLGQHADLGWIELRARRVAPCGPDKTGVEVEVANRGDQTINFHDLRAKLFTSDDAELEEAWDFVKCKPASDIAPGASAKGWFVFKGSPPLADLLELTFSEPRGFGRYRVMLALRETTEAPEIKPATVATFGDLGKVIASPIDTRFYRVALTGVRACRALENKGDPIELGLEVVVENRSNVALRIDQRPSLRDEAGYDYKPQLKFSFGRAADACGDPLPGSVEPGERVRGWVKAYEVPPTAKALTLHFALSGLSYEPANLRLPIGALPPVKLLPPKPAPKVPAEPGLAPTTYKPATKTWSLVDGVKITVTNLQPCAANTRDELMDVGVEVLVENDADVPIQLQWAGRIEDSQHYRYALSSTYHNQASCMPLLDTSQPLKPGEKLRGWLNHFQVPVTARDLLLRIRFTLMKEQKPHTWAPLEVSDITIPIGHLE